jgi:hypothetical protein
MAFASQPIPAPAAHQPTSQPWRRGDVLVATTTVLTTTGGTVWGAAHRALDFLEAERDAVGLTRPGVRVSRALPAVFLSFVQQ